MADQVRASQAKANFEATLLGLNDFALSQERHYIDDIKNGTAAIAEQTARALVMYEAQLGTEIEPLLKTFAIDKESLAGRVQDKVKNGHAKAYQKLLDRLVLYFRQEAEPAAKTDSSIELRAGVKGAILAGSQQQVEKQINPTDENALEPDPWPSPAAREAIRRTISVTGAIERVKNPYNNQGILDHVALIVAIVIVFGIEFLTGFSMWLSVSNKNVALGLNLITIVGFTGLTWLTVKELKRYVAHKDALRRYDLLENKYKALSRVAAFPSSSTALAFGGLAALLVVAVLLLLARINISLPSAGFLGVSGAIGLLFTCLVYGLFEFRGAKPYTPEQYEWLEEGYQAEEREKQEEEAKRAIAESKSAEVAGLAAVQASLQVIDASEEDSPSSVYKSYLSEWHEICLQAKQMIEAANDRRQHAIELLIEYMDMTDRVLDFYRNACDALVVETANKLNLYGDRAVTHAAEGKLKYGEKQSDELLEQQLNAALLRRGKSSIASTHYGKDIRMELQQHVFIDALPDLLAGKEETIAQAKRLANIKVSGNRLVNSRGDEVSAGLPLHETPEPLNSTAKVQPIKAAVAAGAGSQSISRGDDSSANGARS